MTTWNDFNKENKNMKSREIADIIAGLPICNEGRKGVRELVEALGHTVEENRIPVAGEVWYGKSTGDRYLVADLDNNERRMISLRTGIKQRADISYFGFDSSSVEEYYKHKN